MPTTFTFVCLALTLALVIAIQRNSMFGEAVFKTLASLAFIATAWSLGATSSTTGRIMLTGFVLSAVGDVCLLSQAPRWFLAGLTAFLLAHLAYAFAFVTLPLSTAGLLTGAVLMAAVTLIALRWLWPYLHGAMRGAVVAYMLAIGLMCALAVGYAAESGRWMVAAGALLFAASDLSVARQTFVQPAFFNRAWGLPAYYVSQLLLAWSMLSS